MLGVTGPDTEAISRGQFNVTYEDDTGDVIDISCDDDLMSAYDVAENFLNRQLKLKITKNDRVAVVEAQLDQMQIDSKQEKPSEPELKVEVPIENFKKVFKEEEKNEEQIDSTAVKQAIQEIIANKDQEDDSPSDESDEQEDIAQKGKGKKKLAGKGKKQKEFGGLPRKCFKKLIKKELDKQCQSIFKDMMNCKELGGDDEQINSQEQVVHQNVACDGCNVSPIVGVRFKCSICKNFDFCAMCEERRAHDHAFLKIYKPQQVPKTMFTVINEDMPNAKADIEQQMNEANQFPTFFRNMIGNMAQGFGRGGHHGHHGHHGFNRGGPGGWKCGGRGGHGRSGNDNWGMRKASILDHPKDILKAMPGQTIFANIEVQNLMNWGWKEGATLQSELKPETSSHIEEVLIPIDFQVPENSTFKMCVPIKVRDLAMAGNTIHQVTLNFHGRQGRAFG